MHVSPSCGVLYAHMCVPLQDEEETKDHTGASKDSLKEELRERHKHASRFITIAAKLIAPTLDGKEVKHCPYAAPCPCLFGHVASMFTCLHALELTCGSCGAVGHWLRLGD